MMRRQGSRAAPIVLSVSVAMGLAGSGATVVEAQVPFEGEVRQLVTFSFLPGRSAEALRIYTEQVVPLYHENERMRSFRALREVESPVPLDLVVISGFDGMAGMDESNEELRRLAARAGTSIGALYGAIAGESQSHHDQFIEMLPELGWGDPTSERLVALVWYRLVPAPSSGFPRLLEQNVTDWEQQRGTPASTGRFLVSDGWNYLRIIGFDSLDAYQDYWSELRDSAAGRGLAAMTAERREVILAPIGNLAVR